MIVDDEEEFEIQTDESESSDSSSESGIESYDKEVANLNFRYDELLFKCAITPRNGRRNGNT